MIVGYGDAEVLALLKREALAGQVVDYRSLYKVVQTLTRSIFNPYTKSEVLAILQRYLDKLTLGGGIEAKEIMYPPLAAIIDELVIPI